MAVIFFITADFYCSNYADACERLAIECSDRGVQKKTNNAILKAIETFVNTFALTSSIQSIPIDVVNPIDTTQPHSSASLTAVNSGINISMENGIVAANLANGICLVECTIFYLLCL